MGPPGQRNGNESIFNGHRLSLYVQKRGRDVSVLSQETLDPISIENNQILSREGNLNLISILCAVQKEIQN